MRTWFVPSSIAPWLIRTRTTHISFFSSSISHSQPPTSISNPTSKPISDSQIYSLSFLFLDNPNTNTSFPKKSRSETGFSASTEPPRCEFTESISQKKSLEQTHVIKVLLSQRNDPDSAFNYFKWAEKQRGFARGIVDPFCVLLCILVGSPNHHQIARNMLNRYVLGDSSPSSCILVDHLVDCSKRFEFDSDSRIFNYLLNSYVRAGRFNDSFDCFDRMIESNIEPWVMCINVFLTALVRKNMIAEARGLYNNVVSRGVNYDCCTVETMMRACLNDGKADEAERYFWEAKASFIKLDAANYSTAIQAVCRKPNSNVACELLNEMTKMGWVPSVGTFACIIGACVKQGNMVDALKVKDEMVSSGKPMNLIVATSLMKGYYMAGDLDSALNLFDKIVRDGLEPNMVTYSVLIEGCFRGGKMERASELCTQMKLAGIQPSVYIVNSLIRGFLGVHLWEEAFKHFDEAVECGIANVFTYNNMICWLCKEGKVDEACSVWKKMVNEGVEPSVVSYNNLILGHCRKGNMDLASRLFSEMLGTGLKANVLTYSILIDGYFRKGETEQALGMFDQMVDLGISPTDFTFNTFINGLCKVGRTSDAMDMLNKFVEKGFIPNCMSYNSIIDGFIKEGDITSALAVYREMCECGVTPNVVTYTSLIHGFCKSNNIDLALKMRDEMTMKGLQLDVTAYGVLIDGFCKRRDMENACELFNELLEVGLSPNAVVYSSMISGFRNLNNMEEALSLHKKMINEGIPCNLATYTTLIDGLLKQGKILFASELYTDMLSNGIVPDEVTYTVLVHGLCNKGQLENAHKVLEEMDKKSMAPNVLIYNTLIAGYFKEGNLQEAFRLHDEMLDRGVVPDDTTYDILTLLSAFVPPWLIKTKKQRLAHTLPTLTGSFQSFKGKKQHEVFEDPEKRVEDGEELDEGLEGVQENLADGHSVARQKIDEIQ
ncbi:unnamed protein product [Camellia sinensis]